MPNIEIHGLTRKEAENLREKIFEKFKKESFSKELVITIYPDTVRDAKGKDQPFLRLIAETAEIIGKLDFVELDVEYFKLGFFYSKDYLKKGEK